MSEHLSGILDIGLAFAVVLGLAVWQLVSVRRSIRRDREAAGGGAGERTAASDPDHTDGRTLYTKVR